MAKVTVFEILKKDHREVKSQLEKLISKCDKSDSIDYKKVEKVCDDLMLHMKVEEKYVYPKAEKVRRAEKLIGEAYEEHQGVKDVIRTIKKSMSIDELGASLEQILEDVEHHVQEEEHELFPILEQEWSAEVILKVTEEVQKMREREMA